ncbi:hypothetical protein BT69DRAFT_661653 [Atractiella rhizophila]|nr:hypothetical protein BT69DRAFT_661653 [Atractiella rhizophila]
MPMLACQLAGSSVLCDVLAVHHADASRKEWSDDDYESIHNWESAEWNKHPYSKVNVAIVEECEKIGVKAHIVYAPLIYGRSRSIFHPESDQVPKLVGVAMKNRRAAYLFDGAKEWSNIHIFDVSLYIMALLRGIESVPSGKQGRFFAVAGKHSWKQLAEMISVVLSLSPATPYADMNDAVQGFTTAGYTHPSAPMEMFIAVGFTSHSLLRASNAAKIGWAPTHSNDNTFAQAIKEDYVLLQSTSNDL